MSAKFSLFTSTQRVLKLAIVSLMTKASSWGWWSRQALSFVKLMAELLTFVILGNQPEIWTLFTIHKYFFLAFLKEPAIALPPTITLISPSGALGRSSTYQLSSRSLGGFSSPLTNLRSFSSLIRASIYCFRL